MVFGSLLSIRRPPRESERGRKCASQFIYYKWMVDKILSAIHFFYRGVCKLSVEEGVLTFAVLWIIDGALGTVVTLSRINCKRGKSSP